MSKHLHYVQVILYFRQTYFCERNTGYGYQYYDKHLFIPYLPTPYVFVGAFPHEVYLNVEESLSAYLKGVNFELAFLQVLQLCRTPSTGAGHWTPLGLAVSHTK